METVRLSWLLRLIRNLLTLKNHYLRAGKLIFCSDNLFCSIISSHINRFAQRVSLIKNRATINEEMDPGQVIKRLKNEILNLREEIVFLKVTHS